MGIERTKEDTQVVDGFRDGIIFLLTGADPLLKDIPYNHLDFQGFGALLEQFNSTSGRDREYFITALGDVVLGAGIMDESRRPAVIAQTIQLITIKDLAQLDGVIKQLETKPLGSIASIRDAIKYYHQTRSSKTHLSGHKSPSGQSAQT